MKAPLQGTFSGGAAIVDWFAQCPARAPPMTDIAQTSAAAREFAFTVKLVE
jgi:hypothetical protein